MVISAIASVAMAAGEQFRPYYAHVYSFMKLLLVQTGEGELLLRPLKGGDRPREPLLILTIAIKYADLSNA